MSQNLELSPGQPARPARQSPAPTPSPDEPGPPPPRDGRPALRVLHIGTEQGWRGGENQLLTLARGLQARGHANLILTPPGSELAQRARADGVDVIELAMRGEWNPLTGWRVRQAARSFAADIVHAHTAHAHALGLWAADKRGGRPKLVVTRRVDFEIAIGRWSRRKYLSPLCHYIAISSGVREALAAGGVPRERIRVVASGVDPQRFTYDRTGWKFRLETGCGPGDFLIGNVGALTDHKGHAYLIDAADAVIREAPNARFCVVGDGELKDQLIAQTRRLGLTGRFRFAGYRDDIEECLTAFDLFALSSHLEGLCTSLIDAMLLGVPVVATRAGGVPDLVSDGLTGLLVAPKDPAALAGAILRLMRDEELRKTLSRAAHENVLRHFTDEQMIAGTEQAYTEILAEGKRND